MQGDSMLFVRERSDGLWTLPGGWADPCYSPRQCVEKEVREESGLETTAVKLLAVYDRSNNPHPPFPFQVYKLFFLCSVVGGRLAISTETSDTGFFREDEVDDLSTARVTQEQIARMFEHVKNPDWATDFD
jgi:ADP-ribose pyrophosphatase YjhB (NUDIX family)